MASINISIIVLLVALVPLIIGIVVVTLEIIKQRKMELLLFLGIMLSICISYIAGIIVHLTLSPVWKIFTLIHFIPVSICSILVVDILKRETIEPWKLGFTLFLCGILFISLLQPDSFVEFQYSNGDWYLASNFTQSILTTVLLVWSMGVFVYYAILLMKKAPPSLKIYAYLFIFALLLIAIGPIFALNVPRENQIPHLDTITNSLGFLLFAFIFSKNPSLFYVLPFTVYRLTVIDVESGISLYDHIWEEKKRSIHKLVYSGLIQGIRVIVKESLNQGEINEIKTKDAVILFELDAETNLAFILVSSKSSQLLKNALKRFAARFVHKNKDILDQRTEVTLFKESKEIIKDIFQFLPK